MKKILITGANSYIGTSFETWAKNHYKGNFEIDTVDMIDGSWREKDFSAYQAVFHVAGIAHADVGNVSEERKQFYYKINRDLAIETAEKAKNAGVSQFIFMSSMIIYGESAGFGASKIITNETKPHPANFYGDSKWQADKEIRKLETPEFQVAVVRPPMIYGKGSKGNYPMLAKLARKLPVFPDIENERSMLHIDNLCEFLCQVIWDGKGGIFFPQNADYVRTSDMVKEIAAITGHKIWVSKIFNPLVWAASKVPGKVSGLVNKAFGSMSYAQELSQYQGIEYQIVDLKESLKRTERKSVQKVLFLVNHDVVIYNFRLELVERLLADGYEVCISSPYGERIEDLKKLGCHYYEIEMDRHGMNPLAEWKLLRTYRQQIREIKPDIILGYTIKPNIYGAIVAKYAKIPFVANITGLGTAVENAGMKQKLMVLLYRFAFQKVQRVFFQNEENRRFFVENHIAVDKHELLPGSGVNLERFAVKAYPEDGIYRFAFISRIMKEKGIDQYLQAALEIKKRHPNTEFHICGFCEEEYEAQLEEMQKNGIVIYHGMIRNVAEFLTDIHCVVHPTYYPEGLSNVLLEACASGRPIITTDRSGCREVVDDGKNGFFVKQKDSNDLIDKIEAFLQLSWQQRRDMGIAGRAKVEQEFDRKIVIQKYLNEIQK